MPRSSLWTSEENIGQRTQGEEYPVIILALVEKEKLINFTS